MKDSACRLAVVLFHMERRIMSMRRSSHIKRASRIEKASGCSQIIPFGPQIISFDHHLIHKRPLSATVSGGGTFGPCARSIDAPLRPQCLSHGNIGLKLEAQRRAEFALN